MGKGKPTIVNIEALLAAGIDPKTGLPIKYEMGGNRKQSIKILLRILDQQEFCNRYIWKNIPANINSQELERMLYYKGQLIMFFAKDVGKGQFFITPYSLDGGIDFYGRYRSVKPVPMSSGNDEEENKQRKLADNALLTGLHLDILYSPITNPTPEDMTKYAVILRDYTNQLPQSLLPRQNIQDAILDVESECIPYASTNMLASCGTRAVRVSNADQSEEIETASASIKNNALNGETMTPVISDIEMQELNDKSVAKSSDYMLVMQSIDNFRMRLLGIKSGGVFEKKAHTLEGEQDLNESVSGLSLDDGLSWRKSFCLMANSLWGCGMDVEVNPIFKDMKTNDVQVDNKEGGSDNGNNDTEVQ